VQAHTLGEVGILRTVLLRVSSGIILPIFIETGSYLTDKKQEISWHSFYRAMHFSAYARSCDRKIGGLQLSYPLLSQEQVKLRTSNLAGTFTGQIRIRAR